MQLKPRVQIVFSRLEILTSEVAQAARIRIGRIGAWHVVGKVFPSGQRCIVVAQTRIGKCKGQAAGSTCRSPFQCRKTRAELLSCVLGKVFGRGGVGTRQAESIRGLIPRDVNRGAE